MKINSYASTGQAIQAPFTFYYVPTNDWSSSHSYQFWNKNFTTAVGINNDVTLKTIYSPSPSGYVEPKTAAFTGFTSTGANTNNSSQYNVSGAWNNGWNFYTNGWKTGSTISFIALGYRNTYKDRTGDISGVNNEGYFLTAGASSTSEGRSLDFLSFYVMPQRSDIRSCGFSIRSVKE